MRRRIPVYMDEKTTKILEERFDYCFKTPDGSNYPPILDSRLIAEDMPVEIAGEGGVIGATALPHDPWRHGCAGLSHP